MCFIKGNTNTCRSALRHTRASSYMSDCCLFLHSAAESCDTAKCALCTCPWNDHSQSASPWRNNLVKSKANKFTHHRQSPDLCVLEPRTSCFYFFAYICVWAYPRACLFFFLFCHCKVLFDWFSTIWFCKSTISIMLGSLRPCPSMLLPISAKRWMNGGEVAGRGTEKVNTVRGNGEMPVQ